MARRKRSPSSVPEDVVRHSPVPFDDGYDLPDVPSGVTPPRRVTPWPDSQLSPLSLRRPGVYLTRASPGVWGGSAQVKPVVRKARGSVAVNVSRSKTAPSIQAKRAFDERRRFLFNVLVSPFSRRARHCLIRKSRREVIFALRKLRRINPRSPGGAGGYRRTQSSQWRC